MGLFDSWRGKAIRLTDGDFWRSFFGLGNYANKVVTPDTALQLDAVWACVKLISETVGTLPCVVYEKDGATVARGHPLYELVHDAPNLDNTSVEFWEGIALSLLLYGNAFAEKKTNAGRLVALNILHPSCVKVERESAASNRLFYTYTEKGKTRKVTQDRMFHVRGLSFGGDVGLSPIAVARQTIGNAMAAEETAGKMFANGMQAAGVLTSPGVLTTEQRKQIAENMQQYAGSDKAGKLMILEAGFDYKQLSLNPQDAQMLETRQFGVEQICRWFGVPPVMIGHAAKGVTTWGSGVEQLILQFTKTGLRPMLRRIEAAIRRDLLSPADRKNYKIEFAMEGLLRGDSVTRADFLTKMVSGSIYTINEARAYENKPPREGGDQLIANSTMLPIDKLGDRVSGANGTQDEASATASSPPTQQNRAA